MKFFLIQRSLRLIKKYYPTYDDEKLAEIEYGLLGIYLTVTKMIVILLLAWIMKIIPEVIFFIIVFNIIRTCSFGLHATKSWICLITSTVIFIGVPLLCTHLFLPNAIKWWFSVITVFLIYKNSPADTEKRPIVNKKRRKIYKLISTFTACIFGIFALCIQNDFYSNCFVFAPIVQCFLISPMVYNFFNLPYNNYKTYLAELSNAQ